MTTVRIYQSAKTAMQSGKAKTKNWHVEFETQDPLTPEPPMGWVKGTDMSQELHLEFPSLSEALHYAVTHGFQYTVCTPSRAPILPKNYASNFTNPRVRGI